ncbi:hypothetical protein ElyMa_000546700 [Elysia marginata]|uniref:Uncharacterized protein n=1 Tax=Elysia marginata TaxID=1093978 RepID=A0AAV4G266_9GAST|nr:hypothetical protein ElyMa_000546700 [Elysia marginata]
MGHCLPQQSYVLQQSLLKSNAKNVLPTQGAGSARWQVASDIRVAYTVHVFSFITFNHLCPVISASSSNTVTTGRQTRHTLQPCSGRCDQAFVGPWSRYTAR